MTGDIPSVVFLSVLLIFFSTSRSSPECFCFISLDFIFDVVFFALVLDVLILSTLVPIVQHLRFNERNVISMIFVWLQNDVDELRRTYFPFIKIFRGKFLIAIFCRSFRSLSESDISRSFEFSFFGNPYFVSRQRNLEMFCYFVLRACPFQVLYPE